MSETPSLAWRPTAPRVFYMYHVSMHTSTSHVIYTICPIYIHMHMPIVEHQTPHRSTAPHLHHRSTSRGGSRARHASSTLVAMISHVQASDDFLWQVTKKHTCFTRVSTSGHGARFSAEPGNVTAEVSFKASGLANSKTIDIQELEGAKRPASTCNGKKLAGTFHSQAGEVKACAAATRPDLAVREESFRVFERASDARGSPRRAVVGRSEGIIARG